MKIKIIDFQKVTTYYKNYRDGISKIDERKDEIIRELEPLKKKMNDLIRESQSGLSLSNKTEEQRVIEFQQLQNEAMNKNSIYDAELKEMSAELNDKTFDELSDIIEKWSIENDIDLVISNMEVVYTKESNDGTEDLLNILKEMNLYLEDDVTEENSIEGKVL